MFRVLMPPGAAPDQLFASAVAVGAQVRHLKPSVPTLEDVFAEAVGERLDAHSSRAVPQA